METIREVPTSGKIQDGGSMPENIIYCKIYLFLNDFLNRFAPIKYILLIQNKQTTGIQQKLSSFIIYSLLSCYLNKFDSILHFCIHMYIFDMKLFI